MCPSVDPAQFPLLTATNSKDTSPTDTRYNCIAYAAAVLTKWWWPDSNGIGYWPKSAPREETLSAFILSYGTIGYVECADGKIENGFEKVAIYAKGAAANEPTHAARQLLNGKWTSKLGPSEDIQHDTLEVLDGPIYGKAVKFMKRAL